MCNQNCVINSMLNALQWLLYSARALLKTLSLFLSLSLSLRPPPLLHTHAQSPSTLLAGTPVSSSHPFKVPQVSLRDPDRSRMSRQLTQLPTPDLPAGASPQFGTCTQPAGSLTGGHLNSMTGLKSLLQHPMKGDQRLKALCDVKGEEIFLFDDLVPCHNVVYV